MIIESILAFPSVNNLSRKMNPFFVHTEDVFRFSYLATGSSRNYFDNVMFHATNLPGSFADIIICAKRCKIGQS